MRHAFFHVFVLIVAGFTGSVQAQSESLDDLYAGLEKKGFNGIVMIERNGKLDAKGFGFADREAQKPFDKNTVFDVGSITKQFTGAAIVKLEMEGKLSVKDRLGDHVPYATGKLADVTLHELLTHTAGLPGGMGNDYDEVDRKKIVEMAATEIEYPAQGFEYSNTGYSMLGAVIEEITGGSYEAYLHEALFKPAGMTMTGYVIPDWSKQSVAVGYGGDEALGRPHELSWDKDGPWWHLRANGGILSTGIDLMKWHNALLGDEILNAEAKRKLYGGDVPERDGETYGYGWGIRQLESGSKLITHNGGNGIFFADFLRFVDDDLTIVVATNTAGADEDLARRIADVLLGTNLAPPERPDLPDDLTDLPLIEDFPDTEAGKTIREMFAAMTEATEAERQKFATDHVPPQLADGLSPPQIAGELGSLQEELAKYSREEIRQSGEFTFVVFMNGKEGNEDAILTFSVNPEKPSKVAFFDLEIRD
jgi:CubicO group peptidase (beta-lactamase class C family)